LFQLQNINNNLTLTNQEQQLSIDFASKAYDYRRKHGGGKGQMIAKACGLNKYQLPLTILDATAGVGSDAFILASLGCTLHLCEANPQLYALLHDAHQRALAIPQIQAIATRMQIYSGNSLELIAQIGSAHQIDVIYFDPMFPKNKKNALPKNAMQVLQHIAVENNLAQEQELLSLAKQFARKRIVVKRHKNSPFFANTKAHASIIGQTNRFDLYMSDTPHINPLDSTF
jgi:16S rRNA (guanine1516-N2)-methyltransferase